MKKKMKKAETSTSAFSIFKKPTRKTISRILYIDRSQNACYLSALYIAAKLLLFTPRFLERAAPIFIAEKIRYT
ncbi:hypothetical protein QF004_001517 [Chryseobacterium sp. MDT2-18]|nr:hypothetical protein [Chryseobacterium sp. MDT2-18]